MLIRDCNDSTASAGEPEIHCHSHCGSDRGGERAAAIYLLIVTARLNGTDPRAWLADVLRRINDHPASRLHELLPWNWNKPAQDTAQAA